MANTLVEAREAVRDALNDSVEGLSIRAYPVVKNPKQGDGWVTVSRIEPSDYSRSAVTLVAVVILGADESNAEVLFDTWAVSALDAVTTGSFPVASVTLEPTTVVVDSGSLLFAFTVTITTEAQL